MPQEMKLFLTYQEDLSCTHGLVLKDNAIVIPKWLRRGIVCCIHAVNQRTEKCIQRAHEDKPYLLRVDYYSKWGELKKLKFQTIACVIKHLKNIFARFSILAMIMSGGDNRMALLEMHNTSVINELSPAELPMGCRLRAFVPVVPSVLNPVVPYHKIVCQPLSHRQAEQKLYYDKHGRKFEEQLLSGKIRVQTSKVWIKVRNVLDWVNWKVYPGTGVMEIVLRKVAVLFCGHQD
ncbi:hypothetical protein PR048_009705 [Dryococelus australis]|uniref:Uncharacterized protein n=1 Tax=Dryococelus australis TaxID=614101 RepID=A0ABQ9I117_9NEOP|nr:hypothetical protein PR048_009705 [Dryococelus australis]